MQNKRYSDETSRGKVSKGNRANMRCTTLKPSRAKLKCYNATDGGELLILRPQKALKFYGYSRVVV